MPAAKRYSELIAWQKAMALVEEVYKMTRSFPKDELYGLTGQLRRSAVSIRSNIAEGHGRRGAREYAHCLSIAHGSLNEVETQIEIARRMGYISKEEHESLCSISGETGRLIGGLLNSLERSHA